MTLKRGLPMSIVPVANLEAASDEELVLIAKSGGKDAFDVLSERYAPVLKLRAMRYSSVVGSDTEDFVQEGMLALFKAVKSFNEKQGAQFKTYAAACVNNAMATAVKRQIKTTEKTGFSIDAIDKENLAGNAVTMPAEDIYIEREHSALLKEQIKSLLSDFEWQVLKLYLRGHSYLQTAQMLSTTTKAVDNALQRVRRKLRPEL